MAQVTRSEDLQYLRTFYQSDLESEVIERIYHESGYNKEKAVGTFRDMGFKYPCKHCTFLNQSTVTCCVMCGIDSKYGHIPNEQHTQGYNWSKTETKKNYIYEMERKMRYSQSSPSNTNRQSNQNMQNNQTIRPVSAAANPANQFCARGNHDMVGTRPEHHEVNASRKKGHHHSAQSNTNVRARIGPLGAFGSVRVNQSSSEATTSHDDRKISIKSSGVTRYLYCKKCPFSKPIFDPDSMVQNAANFIGK